jgi:hypothetical protein
MPVGKPTLFQGNIRAINKDAFGFFYCEIIAPDNLEHPIIQTHVKINNMTRTIAPIGQWSDMIFSEELNNAMKFGYKFEILWGYKFERKIIFKDYVETLYNLRLQYPKSNPLNLIAKLLLNSLYGRFGMIDSFPNIDIMDVSDFIKFEELFSDDIIDFVQLDNKIMVIYRSNQKNINTLLDGHKESHNVSIAIASAITAYARIHMSQFKNNSDYNLFYSDTDSIYIDKPLSEDLVNSKILGKMKLENIIKKGEFKYYKSFSFDIEDVRNFLHVLDSDRIYTLIPFISINNKIVETINLFNIQSLDQFFTIFKYKSVEIDFESYKNFG